MPLMVWSKRWKCRIKISSLASSGILKICICRMKSCGVCSAPLSRLRVNEPKTKIGVLDSGVGGLSVLREIHRLLPNHPTIYVADQLHLPYGPRSAEEVRAFVFSITEFLIDQGA